MEIYALSSHQDGPKHNEKKLFDINASKSKHHSLASLSHLLAQDFFRLALIDALKRCKMYNCSKDTRPITRSPI